MFSLYVSAYPHMGKDSFKTFNEFYESMKPKKIDNRSKEKLMDEILTIESSFKKGD